jgi:CBS domain-containing protein
MLSYFLVESDREQQEFLDEVLDLSALMTMEPVSLEPEQTVGDALELMLRFRIGSIPVVNSMNELIGIVTDYDLLKLLDAKLK